MWDPSSELSGSGQARDEHGADCGPLLELDTSAIAPVGPPIEEMSTGSRGLAMLWDELDDLLDLDPDQVEQVLDAATMDPGSELDDDDELEPEEEPWLVPEEDTQSFPAATQPDEELTGGLWADGGPSEDDPPEEYTVDVLAGTEVPLLDRDVEALDELLELPTAAIRPLG